jgi:ABC-type Na+ efflux pump permease subunit
MEPQFQYQAPAPQPDFNFILNPNQPQKRAVNPGSMKQRILVVVIGLVLLLIIGSIAFTLLANAGKENTTGLIDILADQQEVIRIAGKGDKATSQDVRDLAITTKLTVTTDQLALKAYVTKKVGKLNETLLAAKKNTKTDAALDTALASGQYDDVYQKSLNATLSQYIKDLQTESKTDKNAKPILANCLKTLTVIFDTKSS